MASTEKSGSKGFIKLVFALVSFVLYYYGASLVGVVISEESGFNQLYTVYGLRSFVALLAFVLLGGARYLIPNPKKIFSSISFTKALMLFNLIICALAFCYLGYQIATQQRTEAFDFAAFRTRALTLLVVCILVGINEEIGLRGLAFGGLLAVLGKRRWGVMVAAVLSSLLFGYLHVSGDLAAVNSTAMVIQVVAKTLESAVFGFCLCAATLKFENIWGPILTHCLSDWFLFLCTSAVSGSAISTSYVSADATTSYAVTILFAIQFLFFLPTTIKSCKALWKMELPQQGPFVKQLASAASDADAPRHAKHVA